MIAPPPLLYAGTFLIGLLLDHFGPQWETGLGWPLRYTLGSACIAAACALVTGALVEFRRARTNVVPWRPTTAIVTGGVYRFTRNPMYLAMTLAYFGAALLTNSVVSLVLLPVLLVLMQVGVIQREERYLDAKFGDVYRRYKSSVRRWV